MTSRRDAAPAAPSDRLAPSAAAAPSGAISTSARSAKSATSAPLAPCGPAAASASSGPSSSGATLAGLTAGAPLRIAIVGAESTGKTTLARDLAAALAAATPDDLGVAGAARESAPAAPPAMRGRPAAATPSGLAALPAVSAPPRVALVSEVLREWCEQSGRTPRRDEQAGILAEQHRRIEAAAAGHDIVVCDTTALLTHVYSELVFGDGTLLEMALERHRTMTVTLLTALDLPWVADGHQRDGEHVRRPVDDRLRELLLQHGVPFAVVSGQGPERLTRALAALRPALAARPGRRADDAAHEPGPGLRRRDWVCDCCVPEAERALARARAEARLRALVEPAAAGPAATAARGAAPAARRAALQADHTNHHAADHTADCIPRDRPGEPIG